jgi:hypothetical protein
MLKKHPIWTLAAVLFLAEFASWQWSFFPPYRDGNDQGNASYQYGATYGGIFYDYTIIAFRYLWPRIRDLRDELTVIATIGIFIFAATLWRSTGRLWRAASEQLKSAERIADRQSRDMLKSLEIATQAAEAATAGAAAANLAAEAAMTGSELGRKALVADQRPWISVAIEPAGPLTWNDGGFQVSYKITLKNIGKSPALRVTHAEAVVLNRNANLAAQQAGLAKMRALGPIFGAANIMPGDDRQMIIRQPVDRQRVETEAVPGTAAGGPNLITPVLIGTADYTTQFDAETRHTGFIYQIGFWDPAKGVIVTALDPAGDGNIPTERVRILRHFRVDGHVD